MIRTILFIALNFILANSALAMPPQTLDYQGYLTDSSGVPLTGSQSLVISLYNVASGGSALWTQASSPSLTNGRFSLVLDGSGGNPFPAALFDQQIYLGLTVDADPEMTPRQELTSVPSAFEAINADTLDGLHANEVIDAASDEVRTPISSLPFTINQSGSYYLTQNLTASSPNGSQLGQIDITADNVTIDLMGFTLAGNNVNDFGIELSNVSTVTILNGIVRDFGLAGIYASSNSSANVAVSVENMKLIGNGSLGSSANHSGVFIRMSNSRITKTTAIDNGGYGLYVWTNGVIDDCIVRGSGGIYGIYGGNSSRISNNLSRGNFGTYGIYTSNSATITGNNSHENNIGIYALNASTIINNHADNNDRWGIYGASGNTIIGNEVYFNNQDQLDGEGGLRVGPVSFAKDNMANINYHTGIRVDGAASVIKGNHAINSITVGADDLCYEFTNNSKVATNNTGTGCANVFGGAVPPGSQFVDNIAW